MKITDFKPGQIIHRTTSANANDRSFVEDPVEFVGIESGLFFYKYVEEADRIAFKNKINRCQLDLYNDNYWDFFPLKYLNLKDDLTIKDKDNNKKGTE